MMLVMLTLNLRCLLIERINLDLLNDLLGLAERITVIVDAVEDFTPTT